MSKDIMSMTYGELAEVFSGKGLPGFRQSRSISGSIAALRRATMR